MTTPELIAVLETVLYHDSADREPVERFYREALGLRVVAAWGDGLAFRIGRGVLLLFDRARLAQRADPTADHGTSGAGHVCLQARGDDYDRWREQLDAAGVRIVHDHDWGGGRSFYFKDPAGNLLEIADGDLWPSR